MKHHLITAGIAAVSFVTAVVLGIPFSSFEEQVTAWKYRVRGEQRADTNIVLVYIDNETITEIGWPVRRNFHALMINALADLKVRAIGVDVLFEHPNLEYPEYDQLLVSVVRNARMVVLSSYFEKLVQGGWKLARIDSQQGAGEPEADVFDYPLVSDIFRLGDMPHLPIPQLLNAAAGVGHANMNDDGTAPLFVAGENLIVPSLGTEILRVFCGAGRATLRFEHNVLALRREGELLEVDSDNGNVRLNFPGRVTAFTLYPFLEVLKSYDAVRAGRTPLIPVQNLKDKIVLVGAIAEGRTETFATPVDPRLPSLALHAVFLDNALRSGFMRTAPFWLSAFLTLLIAVVCSAAALNSQTAARWAVPAAIVAGFVVISFILFILVPFILPVVPGVIAGVAATGAAFYYRHRFIRQQLQTALSEKERIVAELQDKEAKVAALERELVSVEKNKLSDKTAELVEEIRRHKAEIHALSAKKDDMEEAAVGGTESDAVEFEGIVYRSGGAMQPVVDFVAKIADSDATVLILGESGTGKEMVARAIHRRSRRAGKPFVAVNCGALAENLLESELFGHEKGAFTGAVKDKPGRFELADGGTILLDEIGEVSEAFQLKLLRVLQEGEFERVGGTGTLKINVRVIAATNKDLKHLVKERRFREDLFYRLNVLSVELPPLRDRQADIPLLVNHFLARDAGEMKLSKNVLDTLQSYAWRGNIRELESVVTRAVLLARADKRSMISMKDLSDEIAAAATRAVAMEDQILESLREKGFSRSAISETADELGGLNRGTVAEYLRGQCLKAFVEHTYDLDTTVRYISLSADAAVNERVRKKVLEYLANIAETIDESQAWETLKPLLKAKTRNLPQKYHSYLEQVAEACYRRVWKTPGS